MRKLYNYFSRILLLVCASVVALSAAALQPGEELISINNEKNKVLYRVVINREKQNCWLYYVDALAVVDSTFTVPDGVVYENVNYPLVAIGSKANNQPGMQSSSKSLDGIKKLVIGKNVELIDSMSILTLAGLKEIVWNNKIKTLGKYCFRNCTGLETVTIPACLENIEGNPFVGCTSLTNVSVESGSTKFKSLMGILFNNTYSTLYCYPAGKINDGTELTIPNGCKTIAAGAVFNSAKITKLDLNGTEEIGEWAFAQLGAESLNITAKVKSIGDGVIYASTKVKTITIDPANENIVYQNGFLMNKNSGAVVASTEEIGEVATVPAGAKRVGSFTVYNRAYVTKAVFPSTLEEIGYGAFYSNKALAEANFEETNLRYIGLLAFQATKLSKVVFPATMRRCDDQAFYSCSSIVDLEFNEGLEYVGRLTFGACTKIAKVVVPSTLQNAGVGTFQQCTGIKEVEVKSKIVPYDFFYMCRNIEKVTLHEGVEVIDQMAFAQMTGQYSLFTELKLPSTLKRIENSAFQYNSITELIIPENCTYINYNAFSFARNLEKFVTLGVDTIQSYVIQNAPKLTEVSLNEGVTYVGAAFVKGGNYKQIVLPSTVKRCGGLFQAAPYNATNAVEAIVSWAPVPPEIFPVAGSFYLECAPGTANAKQSVMYDPKTYKTVKLLVPEASIEAYKADPYWGLFETIEACNTSGIEDVEAENTEANEIFYNLQGVKVSEPEAGQVYIKVVGGKATKAIFN